MEKKIKKLQLRKETIAVLNGEKMAHIVGGGSDLTEPSPCGITSIKVKIGPGPDDIKCECPPTYDGNPYIACQKLADSDNLCSGTCGHSFTCQPLHDIVCHR